MEKTGPVDVVAGDVCSECWRPAVFGVRNIYDTINYACEGHVEIHKLYGQLDWLTGERDYVVSDWLKQVQNTDESAWKPGNGLEQIILLKDRVSDDISMPYRWQHETTLESLRAAVDLACKLTQEKIDHEEDELRAFRRVRRRRF